MPEEWKPIPGYERYLISNFGRIYHTKLDKIRTATVDQAGYRKISLYGHGKVVSKRIHNLVAELFIEGYNEDCIIGFYNGDRKDCHVDNLYLRDFTPQAKIYRLTKPRIHSRRVRIVELNMIFRNAYYAAKYINGDMSSVYKCLRGERRCHLGYSFEYVDPRAALRQMRGDHGSFLD